VPDTQGEHKYYSWKTPAHKIEEEHTKDQVEAEQLLLQYIFNSKDHLFNKYNNWANNGRYENGKLVHFDFGEDAYHFLKTPSDRDSLLSRLQHMDKETLAALRDKVSALHDRFSGETGKEFFRSIIAASAAPTTKLFGPEKVFEEYAHVDPLDLLHTVLIERIESLKESLDKLTAGAE
ncbi:MAG: hypothetical protein ACYCZ7_01215, partial [Minisyncoccota bacterium]